MYAFFFTNFLCFCVQHSILYCSLSVEVSQNAPESIRASKTKKFPGGGCPPTPIGSAHFVRSTHALHAMHCKDEPPFHFSRSATVLEKNTLRSLHACGPTSVFLNRVHEAMHENKVVLKNARMHRVQTYKCIHVPGKLGILPK